MFEGMECRVVYAVHAAGNSVSVYVLTSNCEMPSHTVYIKTTKFLLTHEIIKILLPPSEEAGLMVFTCVSSTSRHLSLLQDVFLFLIEEFGCHHGTPFSLSCDLGVMFTYSSQSIVLEKHNKESQRMIRKDVLLRSDSKQITCFVVTLALSKLIR